MRAGASISLFRYGRRQSADANLGSEVCLSVRWIQRFRCTTRRPTRKVTRTCLTRVGSSIVPAVPWEPPLPHGQGPPISCQIFTTLF